VRVGRPLAFGLIADQRPADGMARVESIGPAQRAYPQPAPAGDARPKSGHTALVSKPSRHGFAVPVSSYNADAVAVVHSTVSNSKTT
jgi:hypothetical protein